MNFIKRRWKSVRKNCFILPKIVDTTLNAVLASDYPSEELLAERGKLRKAVESLLPKETKDDRVSAVINEAYLEKNIPAVRASFESFKAVEAAAIKKHRTTNNLKQLMLAVNNYNDVNNSLPAFSTEKANKPMHSWRVTFLPYLENQVMYESIRRDEPWDSDFNKQFHERMPEIFITSYQDENEIEKGQKKALSMIRPDQTSNTLYVTERKEPVCWMDPEGDIEITKIVKGINKDKDGIGSPVRVKGKAVVYALMFDGSVRLFPENMDIEHLKNVIAPSEEAKTVGKTEAADP